MARAEALRDGSPPPDIVVVEGAARVELSHPDR